MNHIFDFDTVGTLYVRRFGSYYISDCTSLSLGNHYEQHKFIYMKLNDLNIDSPRQTLDNKAYSYLAPSDPPQTVYVSSDSKYPRDILRKSYKITRDKDKADCIIIPYTKKELYLKCNMLVKRLLNNGVFLVNLRRINWEDKWDQMYDVNKVIQEIKEGFPNEELEFFYDKSLEPFSVYFVPDIPEYKEILTGDLKGKYYWDTGVVCEASTEISVETLSVWKCIKERNLFEKAVLNSDWQKYPFTLSMFIFNEKYWFGESASPAFKTVLEGINYKFLNKFPALEINTKITPEDWNLCQEWIFSRLGIDGNFGYISQENFDELAKSYKSILKTRIAVGKNLIKEDMTTMNLADKLRNEK